MLYDVPNNVSERQFLDPNQIIRMGMLQFPFVPVCHLKSHLQTTRLHGEIIEWCHVPSFSIQKSSCRDRYKSRRLLADFLDMLLAPYVISRSWIKAVGDPEVFSMDNLWVIYG